MNMHFPRGEVDSIPFEPKDFRLTAPGIEAEQDQGLPFGALGVANEAHLVGGAKDTTSRRTGFGTLALASLTGLVASLPSSTAEVNCERTNL